MRKQLTLLFALAITIITLITTSVAVAQKTHSSQWWQLTLRYDSSSVAILSAKPFDTPKKQVRIPGLPGAPLRLDYTVSWLDSSRRSLSQTTTTIPLGRRTTLNSQSTLHTYIPETGIVVIRLKGPQPGQSPAILRLDRIGRHLRSSGPLNTPSSLQSPQLELSIPKAVKSNPPPGPISATKVRDTGPDSNRLVIAVLGDGYTAADLAADKFQVHTNLLLSSFQSTPPYDVYFNATNVYRVDIESNESGADEPEPGPGIYKDTYLNSSYWIRNIERLLAIDNTGYVRAYDAADSLIGVGIWDDIFVLVNANRYGGSGGTISVSSVHPAASGIIIHEYGHTFAGLADEYDYGSPNPPESDAQPNVDFDYIRANLKWKHWVETDTPLPTPAGSGYQNKVGAFLGAKYSTTGIYRPWENCLMRSLGQPFCPVCAEQTVLSYMNMLDLVDLQSPAPAEIIEVSAAGKQFSVSALPITPVEYQWYIDGTLIPGETSSTVTIESSQINSPNSTLSVKVDHSTLLVRKEEIQQNASWTVTPATSGIDHGFWTFYQ